MKAEFVSSRIFRDASHRPMNRRNRCASFQIFMIHSSGFITLRWGVRAGGSHVHARRVRVRPSTTDNTQAFRGLCGGSMTFCSGRPELRSTIQAATNKNESFNDFVKWLLD